MPSNLSMLHPGTIILEEFLEPKGMSVFRLARDIDVPTRRIYEIVQGATADQRGYCASFGALLRYVRALLAGLAGALRWGAREQSPERVSE
jgi:hypothetical protein